MENEILEILKSMHDDIKELKSDVQGLKSDVQEVKTDVKELKIDVKELNRKMDNVYEQTAGLTEFRTETNTRLNNIEKDTGFIKHKLNRTEEDVYNIQSHLQIIK